MVIGDMDTPPSLRDSLRLPPAPGQTRSSLELLSDPQGVDFKPYLIRILATVRRNWFAVIPESAHLGRRGVGKLPRAPFQYSNFAYGLLGEVLARRAGLDYSELLKEQITDPLGLSDTVVTLSSAQQSRFNSHVAARVLHLEERVRILEQAVGQQPGSRAPSGSRPAD